ncbi:MAG TPA: hypothetical protein PLN69_06205 [bacterium]|nr:hypothetical protein [bacterium]
MRPALDAGFKRKTAGFLKSPVSLCLLLMFLFVIAGAGTLEAATFEMEIPGGEVVKSGGTGIFRIYLVPADGEKVVGAQVTLTSDVDYVRLSKNRDSYAADPAFSLVEKFNLAHRKGIIVFRAKTPEPFSDRKIFLEVPYKVIRPGVTFVSYSAMVVYEDGRSETLNPGYLRIIGYEGDEADPVLYSSVSSDNDLLAVSKFEQSVEKTDRGETSVAFSDAGMGLTALEKADDEAAADVVVGFSKSYAKMGVNEWIRMDVVIEKFPRDEMLTGMQVRIKFDPKYLAVTDRNKRVATELELQGYLKYKKKIGNTIQEIEVQTSLDDMSVSDLQQVADGLGVAYSKGASKEDLIKRIEEGSRWDYRSILTMPFDNRVDNTKGEINLTVAADITKDITNIQTPHTVATILFKSKRQGKDIPITMEEVMVPVQGGTQFVRNAMVTVDSSVKGCDSSLPATLCAGSFRVNGNLSLSVDRTVTPRRTTVARQVVDPSTNQTSTVFETQEMKIEKFTLEQAWNMYLEGSFQNGLTIDGELSERPGQLEQHLDVEIGGKNGMVHFGDFSTDFESGTMISLDRKKINGMQFDYSMGDLEFGSLLAEAKSTTKTGSIKGNGTYGPYTLPSGLIIPGTVHVFDERGNEIFGFEADLTKRELHLSEALMSDETITISYEEATALFSTGNLTAFRMGYTLDDPKGSGDLLKLGASYLITSAPKSLTLVTSSTSETVDLNNLTSVDCPYDKRDVSYKKQCSVIFLSNRYILEDSLSVTNTDDEEQFFPADEGPVYVAYRGYYLGRIYIERGGDVKDSIKVSYTYYNPDLVSDSGVLIYKVPTGSGLTDTNDLRLEPKPPWPQNIFPGSELVLLSADDSGVDKSSDTAICHIDDKIYSATSGVEWVDQLVCPLPYNEETETFYEIQFEDAGADAYIEFRDPEDKTNEVRNIPGTYEYIKIRYSIIPADISSGSEFTKTAMGFTAKAKLGNRLTIDGELAKTNSDLAATYNTQEDKIDLDVYTFANSESEDSDNDTGESGVCKYYGRTPPSEDNAYKYSVICDLGHANITDSVTVELERCVRDTKNTSITENDMAYASFECKEEDGEILYESFLYEVPRRFLKVDRAKGRVAIVKNWETEGSIDGLADAGNYFPNRGDRLIIDYIFDRSLGQVVDGSSYNIKAGYTGQYINASVSKRSTDPFFDTGAGGSSTAMSNSDNFETKLSTKLGNWDFDLTKTENQNQTISSLNLETSSYRQSSTRNFTARFNRQGSLINSFTVTNSVISTLGESGLTTSSVTGTDLRDETTLYNFTSDLKPNVLSLGGSYSYKARKDAISIVNTSKSNDAGMTVKYNPRRDLGLTFKLTQSNTKKENSEDRTDARNNDYGFKYKPFGLVDVNANFTNSVSSQTGRESEVKRTTKYSFNALKSLYRMDDINLTFNSSRNSQQGSALNRTDQRTLSFKVELPYGLQWRPTVSRGVSGQGTSYRRTQKRDWSLSYSQNEKKIRSVSWSRTNSNTKSPDSDGELVSKSDSSDNIRMSVNPGEKGSLSVSFNRRPSSSYMKWGLDYTHKYSSEVELKFNFDRDRTGGTNFTRKTKYSLDSSIRMNENTSFNLKYERNLSRYSNQNTATTDTRFHTTLSTSFD